MQMRLKAQKGIKINIKHIVIAIANEKLNHLWGDWGGGGEEEGGS